MSPPLHAIMLSTEAEAVHDASTQVEVADS